MISANVRFLLVPRAATGLCTLEATVGAAYHYSVTEACVLGREEACVAGPNGNLRLVCCEGGC